MKKQGCKWPAAQQMECDFCAAERKRRNRLLSDATANLYMRPSFATALYITAYSKPKYMASQKHVLTFAQYNNAQVLWMRATDIPKSDSLEGVR
eukprot:1758346-Karenia_brevis.AAC.1